MLRGGVFFIVIDECDLVKMRSSEVLSQLFKSIEIGTM